MQEADSNGGELDVKHVLVLEDDQDLVELLKELLESHGFAVTTAGNGEDGLREVMARNYDVIMCDLMMPTMPGDTFYSEVQRARPHLARRFIFLTGHSDNPKINEFLRQTRGVVLYKPVSLGELMRSISTVLESAPATS